MFRVSAYVKSKFPHILIFLSTSKSVCFTFHWRSSHPLTFSWSAVPSAGTMKAQPHISVQDNAPFYFTALSLTKKRKEQKRNPHTHAAQN